MKIKYEQEIFETKQGIPLPKCGSMPIPRMSMLATMSGNSSPRSEMITLTKMSNLCDNSSDQSGSEIFHFPENLPLSSNLKKKLILLEENQTAA